MPTEHTRVVHQHVDVGEVCVMVVLGGLGWFSGVIGCFYWVKSGEVLGEFWGCLEVFGGVWRCLGVSE